MSERHYKDGEAYGRWTSWSEDGKITYQENQGNFAEEKPQQFQS